MSIRRSDFSTGGASSNLSAALSQWAGERQVKRTKANRYAAFERGQRTGSEGEYKEESPLFGFIGADTVDAHNKGMRDAYIASVDSDNTARINEIALNNSDDVQGFDAASEALLASVRKGVDPAMADMAVRSAQGTIDRARLTVQKNAFKSQKAKARADRGGSAAIYAEEAARLARNGDQQGSIENIQKFEAVLQSQLEQGDIDQHQYSAMKQGVINEAQEQEYINDLANMELVDAELWIETNRNKVPRGFSPDEWDGVIDRTSKEVNLKKSAQAAELRKNQAANKVRLNDYISKTMVGADVSPEERETIAAIDPEAAARGEAVSNFAQLSYDKQVEFINESGSIIQSADPIAASMIRASHNAVREAASKDLYKTAVQQGRAVGAPIVAGPDMAADLMERKLEMVAQSEHYGVPLQVLGSENAAQFGAQLDSMTTPEKLSIIQAIDASGADEVYKEIAGKGYQVLAVAGGVKDSAIASHILAGSEALKLGTVKGPAQGDYLKYFNEIVKDVYLGKNRQALQEAVIAHYVSNHPDPVYDKSKFKESIDAITNGFGDVNGGYVALPKGITDNQMERYIDDVDAQSLDAPAMGLTLEQTADYIQRGTPFSAGNNKYGIEIFGQRLANPDGSIYTFSVKPEHVAPPPSTFMRIRGL